VPPAVAPHLYTSYLLCIVCATFPQSSQGRSLPTSRATCPESILSTAPPRRFMCIKLCSPRRINFFVSRAHTHAYFAPREKHRGASHGEFNHDSRTPMPSPIMVLFSCASAHSWCDLVSQSVRESSCHTLTSYSSCVPEKIPHLSL